MERGVCRGEVVEVARLVGARGLLLGLLGHRLTHGLEGIGGRRERLVLLGELRLVGEHSARLAELAELRGLLAEPLLLEDLGRRSRLGDLCHLGLLRLLALDRRLRAGERELRLLLRGVRLGERRPRLIDGGLFGGACLGDGRCRLAERAGGASVHRVGHIDLLCFLGEDELLRDHRFGVGTTRHQGQLVHDESRDLAEGPSGLLHDGGGEPDAADAHHLVDAVQDLLDGLLIHDVDVRLDPPRRVIEVELEDRPGVLVPRVVHLAEHGPLHEPRCGHLEGVVVDDLALTVGRLGGDGAVDEQRAIVELRDVLDRRRQAEGRLGSGERRHAVPSLIERGTRSSITASGSARRARSASMSWSAPSAV